MFLAERTMPIKIQEDFIWDQLLGFAGAFPGSQCYGPAWRTDGLLYTIPTWTGWLLGNQYRCSWWLGMGTSPLLVSSYLVSLQHSAMQGLGTA